MAAAAPSVAAMADGVTIRFTYCSFNVDGVVTPPSPDARPRYGVKPIADDHAGTPRSPALGRRNVPGPVDDCSCVYSSDSRKTGAPRCRITRPCLTPPGPDGEGLRFRPWRPMSNSWPDCGPVTSRPS